MGRDFLGAVVFVLFVIVMPVFDSSWSSSSIFFTNICGKCCNIKDSFISLPQILI
jgi:hypothetical protein